MKRLSKPLIAVIVTLIVALVAGMVSAVWIIMTPLTDKTGSSFRPDNIEEKVTISFNYGEFSEVSGYPANQEAHAPIEAIAGQEITLPTGNDLTYKPKTSTNSYGLSAWQSGNGVHYEPGQKYPFEANVTLTPIWAEVIKVTFVSEGQEKLTREIEVEVGASFDDPLTYKSEPWPTDLETENAPAGKVFEGWYDGTGTTYSQASNFVGSVTLTARFSLPSSKFDKVYFGLVGTAGNSSSPLSLTDWDYKFGNAALLQFRQDKDHLYTSAGGQDDSAGTYTKFEQDIYLFSGDEFAIIGTQTESGGGPLFARTTSGGLPLQQKYTARAGYTRSLPTGDFGTDSYSSSNFVVKKSHGYKITMYLPAKKAYNSNGWENTANITITEITLSSPVTNKAPVVYMRGSLNNWLNDWHWNGFKPTSDSIYTSSEYNFGTPTQSGSNYTYTMEVTLKNDPGKATMTAFEFQAYVANELTWLNLYEKVTSNPLSPNGHLVTTSSSVSISDSNIRITAPGIWKIELVVGLTSYKLQRTGGGYPTNYYYTVTKVSKTVNFSYGAGYDGETPPAERVVKSGDELTLPGAPARAGYKFDGWKSSIATDSTLYQQGDPYKVTADVTFTAQWKKLNTVTYTDPEFPDRVTTHEYVDEGQPAPYTAPDASTWPVGRTFAGWHVSYNKDTGWGDYYRGEPIDGDATLYAKWDYIEYTVKFASSINDATLAKMPTGEYKVSLKEPTLELSKIENPTLTGYTFSHWTFGDEIAANLFTLTEDDVKNMVEGSTELTLTAQWNPITYKIVFDGNKPAAAKYEVGGLSDTDIVYVTREAGKDEIRLPLGVMTREDGGLTDGVELRGYNFMGWNLKNNSGDDWLYDPENLPASSYSAHSPFNATALLDTEMIEKFTVKEGEEYVITFYAQWLNLGILKAKQHIVSFNLNSYGGVVYPKQEEDDYHHYDWTKWDDKVHTDGDDITILDAPHWAGFKFEYWDYRDYRYLLGHSTDYQYSANQSFTVDENDGPQITFDAIWSPITYTINFKTSEENFFTDNGATANPSFTGFDTTQTVEMTRLDSVVLESINTKGFTFKGWEISTRDASGAESTVTINPGDAFTISTAMIAFANRGHTDDETELTLTAQWEKTSYDVVFLTNGHGTAPANTTITLDGSINLDNYTVNLTAEEEAKVKFVSWTLDGEPISGTYTFTYDKVPDNDLYFALYFAAKWDNAAKTYTITFQNSTNTSYPKFAASELPAQVKDFEEGSTFYFDSSVSDEGLYENYTDKSYNGNYYYFLGWQVNGSGTLYTRREKDALPTYPSYSPSKSLTIKEDITLIAAWAQLRVVKFDTGVSGQTRSDQHVLYGHSITMPAKPTRTNYTFNYWYYNSSNHPNAGTSWTWNISPTSLYTITFNANWTANFDTITITYNHKQWSTWGLANLSMYAYNYSSGSAIIKSWPGASIGASTSGPTLEGYSWSCKSAGTNEYTITLQVKKGTYTNVVLIFNGQQTNWEGTWQVRMHKMRVNALTVTLDDYAGVFEKDVKSEDPWKKYCYATQNGSKNGTGFTDIEDYK